MITRQPQLDLRLIECHAKRFELAAQFVRRFAVDRASDGRDGVVVRRGVIGMQLPVRRFGLRHLLVEPIRRRRSYRGAAGEADQRKQTRGRLCRLNEFRKLIHDMSCLCAHARVPLPPTS